MSLKTVYILVYVLVLIAGRFISQSQRKADKLLPQAQQITKDPTAIVMAIAVLIGFGLPLLEAALKEALDMPIWRIAPGIGLMLLGFVLAYQANRIIAENWSPVIGKTQEQRLVKSGVYSVVRHPLYLSGFLIVIGTNIYFGNTWAWISTALVFGVTLYRIPVEDRQLEERFGQEFVDYKTQTKAIIPWIL
jgi:protein-S-isoprenylcysteine O-methyltransferase Ste14